MNKHHSAMNQEQLISKTAVNTAVQKNTVEQCFDGLIDTIEESLIKGESVSIRRFGTLKVTQHKERNRVNPRTLERIVVAATNQVKFDSSRDLLDKIQGDA